MMFAQGIPQMQRDFNSTDSSTATLAMTVYVLSFGIGPLLFSPLSEVYDRVVIYRTCIVIFMVLTIACAFSSGVEMLIAFRFLAGCFGAAPVGIGGSMVSDLFPVERRGSAMAAYQMGPILGNLLGPPFGGLIVQRKGWRRVFWIMVILVRLNVR